MRIILEAELLATKELAHEYLKDKLDFPEYYGKNLDALFDCLEEMEEDTIIEIQNYSKELEATYYRDILRVMKAAEINIVYSD